MKRLIAAGAGVVLLAALTGCEEAPKQVAPRPTPPLTSQRVDFDCSRHKTGSDLEQECRRNELVALEDRLNKLAPGGNVPQGFYEPPSQGQTRNDFWDTYFQYVVLRDLLTPRFDLGAGWVSQQPLVTPRYYTKVVVVDGRRYTPREVTEKIGPRVRGYSEAIKAGGRPPTTYAGKPLPTARQRFVGSQQPRVRPPVGQSVGGRTSSTPGRLQQPTRVAPTSGSSSRLSNPAPIVRPSTPAPTSRPVTPAPYTPAPTPRVYTPAPTFRAPSPSYSGGFSGGGFRGR